MIHDLGTKSFVGDARDWCASDQSYDWASMTGDFADPSDYKRLCRSCHWKLDDKITNITGKEFARG